MKDRLAGLLAALMVFGMLIVLGAPAQPAAALTGTALTVFPANAAPATADSGVTSLATIGMAFDVDAPGAITGVRFYKSVANTGTHVGYLFDYGFSNTPLAQVTFTGESASGWQEAYFATPYSVLPGQHYDIAYYAPNGHYAADATGLVTTMGSFPLVAEAHTGGWSQAPPPHQPDTIVGDTNYWVDPIFEPSPTPPCPCTTLGSTLPAVSDGGDTQVYDLGLRFTTYQNGYITGVRFYKDALNVGGHDGKLWADDGTLLATVTFSGETASGWQQANFATPVVVQKGVYYRVSYNVNMGHYSYTVNAYDTASDVMPFHIPAGAGYYKTGFGFPNSSGGGASYSVDPVFIPFSSNTDVSTTIDPSFTFGVGNRSSACNGESNFVAGAGTATSVALGNLAAAANVSGGQALTVAGNAGAGFVVYARGLQASQNLRTSGHNWTDVSGSYASPAVLGAGERFGYTYHDTTTGTTVTNPASATFAALDGTNRAVMGSATAAAGSGCISFDAQASSATPAGAYSATVIYTAVPVF